MAYTKIHEINGTGVTSMVFTSPDSPIDSTYKVYRFVFYEINPAASTGSLFFAFQGGVGTGTSTSMTTTTFKAEHYESGGTGFSYDPGTDQANGALFQKMQQGPGADSTEAVSGELLLFNPSSTTFVKHFIAENIGIYEGNPGANWTNIAGYFNVATAITGITFKMMDDSAFDGTIQMWGL